MSNTIQHPINRPHSVDIVAGDFLHRLYSLLFQERGLNLRTKQRTFETAAECENSWRVVSISENAISHLLEHRSAKGLQRGHILSRKNRAEYIFNREFPLSQSDLLKYFHEHDTVALVTKTENSTDGTIHWSPLYPVPEGLFTSGFFSIYARKLELEWVQTVLK